MTGQILVVCKNSRSDYAAGFFCQGSTNRPHGAPADKGPYGESGGEEMGTVHLT